MFALRRDQRRSFQFIAQRVITKKKKREKIAIDDEDRRSPKPSDPHCASILGVEHYVRIQRRELSFCFFFFFFYLSTLPSSGRRSATIIWRYESRKVIIAELSFDGTNSSPPIRRRGSDNTRRGFESGRQVRPVPRSYAIRVRQFRRRLSASDYRRCAYVCVSFP